MYCFHGARYFVWWCNWNIKKPMFGGGYEKDVNSYLVLTIFRNSLKKYILVISMTPFWGFQSRYCHSHSWQENTHREIHGRVLVNSNIFLWSLVNYWTSLPLALSWIALPYWCLFCSFLTYILKLLMVLLHIAIGRYERIYRMPCHIKNVHVTV